MSEFMAHFFPSQKLREFFLNIQRRKHWGVIFEMQSKYAINFLLQFSPG